MIHYQDRYGKSRLAYKITFDYFSMTKGRVEKFSLTPLNCRSLTEKKDSIQIVEINNMVTDIPMNNIISNIEVQE